jgi:hypothetical protein
VKGFCSELIRGSQPATCDVTLKRDCSKKERERETGRVTEREVAASSVLVLEVQLQADSAVVFDEREREEKNVEFYSEKRKVYICICMYICTCCY